MRFLKVIAVLFSLALLVVAGGVGGALYGLWHYGRDLPDFKQLADYQPPTATRLHAGDGRLIAEYAIENRVFVPIESIPLPVIQAFVAAEDQNFYTHPGVDALALARAVVTNVQNYFQNRRLVGASTITQQVAKNFLLTNEVSLDRKIKEAILAFRIEKALSKDRILELYLNEIYLGYGSYGVASAALNYFDKPLADLTVEEAAYLAALPKAPTNYHPIRQHNAARARRNYVIGRMADDGYISPEQAQAARESALVVKPPRDVLSVEARYFVEEVRRELVRHFGGAGVNEGGLSVRTTIDPALQVIARDVLRDGLIAYDRRHGYRGPLGRVDVSGDWMSALAAVETPPGAENWRIAAVLSVSAQEATVGFVDGETGAVPLAEVRWAREALEDQRVGPSIRSVDAVLEPGNVILVEAVSEGPPAQEGGEPVQYPPETYALRQVPAVEGGIVALDPHTGRVLAMQGGWEFARSEFNRATQAARQPGSAIKPFIYLAALEDGYAPNTMILDAPFVIDQGPGLPKWKPSNFSRQFYGPSTMRVGVEKSRNLMTVRLAQAIGMEKVSDTVERFGITDEMPEQLAMALGSGETKLLDLTAAYAMLVNGGRRITPTLIDRVQDRHGRTIFRHDTRECSGCRVSAWEGQRPPRLPDDRERLVNPVSAYQVVSMLEGVVQRGTGRSIAAVGKPLAGKTGTTNESRDAWFIGFSPDLAVGVFIGFDTPTPLGRTPWGGQETGSSVAAPVFKAFMERALERKPTIPFRTPPGMRLVRIDAETGALAGPGSRQVIQEAFRAGTEPQRTDGSILIDGSEGSEIISTLTPRGGAAGSTGGLY